MADLIDHPAHYEHGPVPGIEAIEVTKWFNFCRGNVIKYVWRAGLKDDELEDLRKARRYLDYEIGRLERARVRRVAGGEIDTETGKVWWDEFNIYRNRITVPVFSSA